MQIDPSSLFSASDIAAARRLNRVLALLPRYRTGRRWNAYLLNSLIRGVQALTPTPNHAKVGITALEVPKPGGESLSVRITTPSASSDTLYLFFHGGAWVLGNARLDDGWNAFFSHEAGVTVAAADFHQALDDRLDEALDDAVSMTEWVLDHLAELGARRLIVGGESSGAHLASCALVRLASRRSLAELAGFVSFCGAFDLAGSESLRSAGRRTLLVDAKSAYRNLQRLQKHLAEGAAQWPEYSPYLANLSSMPPALFIAGALDPICEDSRLMHARWAEATDRAELLIVPEAPHGFERLPTSIAAKAKRFACAWMRQRVEDHGGVVDTEG